MYIDRSGEEARADAMETGTRDACFEADVVDVVLLKSAPKSPTKESSTDVILKIAPFPTTVLDVDVSLA